MAGLRLNLGCGATRPPGYVNVDRYGTPDVVHDLESFPWPWPDASVQEILFRHVLEHLGREPAVFLRIMQEMYRVCASGALVRIIVPHHRHEFFFGDPTHVRAITPLGMSLFSQRLNREALQKGLANSPLGLQLGIDFELIETVYKPSADWFRLHPGPDIDQQVLAWESTLYNNLIEEVGMVLRAVK